MTKYQKEEKQKKYNRMNKQKEDEEKKYIVFNKKMRLFMDKTI